MMERVAEILSPSNLDMMSSIGSCLVYRRRTKEMFIHLPSFSQTNVGFALIFGACFYSSSLNLYYARDSYALYRPVANATKEPRAIRCLR
jgi:hypothetical protein